ncbi:unnamed protein product [Blepharisma stoltei]|uniref:Uncharacterized protein n=1 Tax=Blepharisma stoltei TaxID=1481888 RepID=A0AAU9IKA7_9CILI|nr:unnamed protein product [Blepharisma stoltei]
MQITYPELKPTALLKIHTKSSNSSLYKCQTSTYLMEIESLLKLVELINRNKLKFFFLDYINLYKINGNYKGLNCPRCTF